MILINLSPRAIGARGASDRLGRPNAFSAQISGESPARRRLSLWLLVSLAACACACGRKSPPLPPEDVLPIAIQDLAAVSVADGIQLSWTRPTAYVGGSRITDLAGFVVSRAVGDTPGFPIQTVADLEVTDRNRFRQIKRFRYLDADTIVGVSYRYQVVSYTLDGYLSAASNIVAVQREEQHAPLPTPQR